MRYSNGGYIGSGIYPNEYGDVDGIWRYFTDVSRAIKDNNWYVSTVPQNIQISPSAVITDTGNSITLSCNYDDDINGFDEIFLWEKSHNQISWTGIPNSDNNQYTFTTTLADSGLYLRCKVYRGLKSNNSLSVPITLSSGDPYWSSVSLLMHYNDSDGSTNFINSSDVILNITGYGNPTISTGEYKFGGSSLTFDTSSYLSIDNNSALNFGTGNYTCECWVYVTSFGDNGICPFSKNGDDDWSAAYGWELNGSNTYWFTAGASIFGDPISTNTWVHLAAVRTDGTVRIYANGEQLATDTMDGSLSNSYNLTIGNRNVSSQGGYVRQFNGYIDDLRFSNMARYSGTSFIAPSIQFLDF